MKISEILKKEKFSLSFEVFPPKSNANFESIKKATEDIASLKPSFMSVTYGAGGGTGEYTLEIAKNIKNVYSIPTLAHLTCVSSSREKVLKRINDFKSIDIENIMALRGDIPQSMINDDRSSWDYNYAVELIRDIKKIDSTFCIGGACYPEIHPESRNQREEIFHLKEKVDAGCDFLTTQMFFDNKLLYNFLKKIRKAGIEVPVIAGIMPITSSKQVERTVKLSGSKLPINFKRIVNRFGDCDEDMKKAGIEFATKQIIDLFNNGVKNVHVYTMNKLDVASSIKKNLLDFISK